MLVFFYFFHGQRLAVDSPPCIDDISQYERNQNRHIGHGFQGKLAGAAVGNGQ